MILRSSIFALVATVMTLAAEGVSITVNASVDSHIGSVELKSGSQSMTLGRNGSATWMGWVVGNAYSVTGTDVDAGYSVRWKVEKSGQATLEGGTGETITLSEAYTGCTLRIFGRENEYTVTLDMQSGSGGTATVTATYGSQMPAITLPTRTGYTFGGYYSAPNGGGTQYYAPNGARETCDFTLNKTLYAKWTANTYTLTFDRQGGTGGSARMTATYGSAMPGITLPTRTGYTFKGYYAGTTKYYNADGTGARTWDKAGNTTLFAHWDAKTYTVTLDQQGGSGGTSSVTATYGSAMPGITPPTRADHIFGGYYTGINGGGTQYYAADGTSARAWNLDAATTLYALWTARTYTVSFNANGGNGTMAPVKYTLDVPTNLPACMFTRDGWGFKGWMTNANDGVLFADRARVTNLTATVGAEVAMLACWTGITYAVTLDARDRRGDGMVTNAAGESASVMTNLYTVGDAWLLPTPTNGNAHLLFDCWKYVDALGRDVDLPETVTFGVTNLVAAWTWVPDDLAVAVDAPELEFSTFGTVWAKGYPNEASYDADWFAQMNFKYEGKSAVQSGVLPVNTTNNQLYVSWLTTRVDGKGVLSFWWKCDARPVVRSQYAPGGWAGDSLRFGLYDATEGITNEIVRLTNHVDWCKVVYTNETDSAVSFAWAFVYADDGYNNGGGTGWVDRVTWTPETCTVTFDANGGTGEMAAQTFTNNFKQVLSPVAFTRTGYTCSGWATNETGDVVYMDGQNVTMSTDTTLYASWTPNAYTVSFNANGGEGTMDQMPCTYDVPADLPACTFTRDGWDFRGWTTNGAEGVVFADRANVMNLTEDAGGVVRLDAIWTGVAYPVMLDARNPRGDGVVTNAAGESASVVTNFYTVGDAWILPTPTNANGQLEFSKWAYVDAHGVTNDVPAIVPPPSAGMTNLVAVWTWNEVSPGGPDTPSVDPGADVDVPGGDDPGNADSDPTTEAVDVVVSVNTGNAEFTVNVRSGEKYTDEVIARITAAAQATATRHGRVVVGWRNADGSDVTGETVVGTNDALVAQWDSVNPLVPKTKGEGSVISEKAQSYDCYILDASGNVRGTAVVSVGRRNGRTGLAVVKATVKLSGANAGKFKATEAQGGKAAIMLGGTTRDVELSNSKLGTMKLDIGTEGVSGTWGEYEIYGVRNTYKADKSRYAEWTGVQNVAIADAHGAYSTFSFKIAKNGSVRVQACMASGAAIGISTRLMIADDGSEACIAVNGTKKVPLGFTLWLRRDAGGNVIAEGVESESGDAFAGEAFAGGVGIAAKSFALGIGGVAAMVTWDGKSLIAAEDSDISLRYVKSTGVFTGKYKMGVSNARGNSKKSVSFRGVFVDGIGYGTTTTSGYGGVPVTILPL